MGDDGGRLAKEKMGGGGVGVARQFTGRGAWVEEEWKD